MTFLAGMYSALAPNNGRRTKYYDWITDDIRHEAADLLACLASQPTREFGVRDVDVSASDKARELGRLVLRHAARVYTEQSGEEWRSLYAYAELLLRDGWLP